MTSRRTRATLALTVAAALGIGLVTAGAASAKAPHAPKTGLDHGLTTRGSSWQRVVVSGRPGGAKAVAAAVAAAGGRGVRALPIANGVSAELRSDHLVALSAKAGVVAVTADRAVHFMGNSWAADKTSASAFVHTSGADSVWASAKTKGGAANIAILDTGVSDVPDLAGRVLHGPDLSGENNPAKDSFGHGTVMAGVAAGDGSSAGAYPKTGSAPESKIISVKLAGANGAADLTTVLAGLSWVGAFAPTYDIRVVNLSWGIPSTQDPTIDPVNYAVERLWEQGIVVVVASGNSGPGAGTVTKPGDDPLVITVGAYDDNGTASKLDDTLPAWSGQGPTAQGLAKPDVVAPGRSLVSTRAPGSTIETNNPQAWVSGGYITGSGTSQATAVTSGVAALLLSAHPLWTPDMVKAALMRTAVPIVGGAVTKQGTGRIQALAALNANVLGAIQPVPLATGLGSLEASRGAMRRTQVSCNGVNVTVSGENTAWCTPWDSGSFTGLAAPLWNSSSWTSSSWTSSSWTSSSWTSSSWTSSSWTSSSWTSSSWTSSSWTSSSWTSSSWTSNDYDDSQSDFQDAFYGEHPAWNVHVAGEVSSNPPGHGWERPA